MKRLLSSLAITATLALLLASTFGPQSPSERDRQIVLRDGPYKVVIGKPLKPRPWKATKSYVEHEHLTELFNELAIDGLEPVFTTVTTEHYEGDLLPQDRVIVVCRRR